MMKKILFRFFLPLATVFLLGSAAAALAADYVVSGTTDVDGTYTEMTDPASTQDGKPMYSNGTYDLAYEDFEGWWQIQPKGHSGRMTVLYHSTGEEYPSTPPSTTYAKNKGATEGGAKVTEVTGPVLSYSAKGFLETDADTGALNPAPIAITLMKDTFTGDDGAVYDETRAVIANLPEGLTATLTKVSGTELSFALAGQASTHDTDVTDLTVSFTAAAFAASDDIAKVTGAITSDLTIDFIRTHTVGDGKDFPTLATAIAGAGARDRLVLSGTFTECGLEIDKDLTLTADSQGGATIQAFDSATGETNKLLFKISEGAVVSFSNLALRNSITDAIGSAGIRNNGTLTLSGCTLSNLMNTASSSRSYGGAIYNTGNLTLETCRIDEASCTHASSKGGAIYHFGTSLTVKNTTFTGNTAASGGAVYIQSSDNPATLTGTTFSGNSATKSGGALFLFGGEAQLNHVTFYGNTANTAMSSSEYGGAVYVNSGKTLTLTGCLFAANRNAGENPAHDIKGAVTSGGHNLVAMANGSSGITDAANHDQAGSIKSPLDPVIAPVLTDGVHHLLAGSPAIDAASAALAPATDQLGAVRSGTPDIGAVEYVPAISGFLTVSIAGHTDLPVREATIALEGGASGSPTASGFFRVPVASTLSGPHKLTITSPALDSHEQDLALVKGKGHHLGTLALAQTAVATQDQVDKAVAEAIDGRFTQEEVNTQIDNAISGKVQEITAAKEAEKQKALAAQRATLLKRFDADGDGKLGLTNAIRALEVTAGIRRGEAD